MEHTLYNPPFTIVGTPDMYVDIYYDYMKSKNNPLEIIILIDPQFIDDYPAYESEITADAIDLITAIVNNAKEKSLFINADGKLIEL